MNNSIKLLGIFFLVSSGLTAQNIKFGKVSKEELLETKYEKDTTASAVVLYRNLSLNYHYSQNTGFDVVTNVRERIKVYNKEGFKYTTIEERLYKGSSEEESISGLKAYSYNIENDEIIKTKLKGSDVFKEQVNKYYKKQKFTMPNIKEGTVIEYEYQIHSPFAYSIDEIFLQYDIPIKKQEIRIATPEYYSFKPNMKGYLSIVPKHSKKSDRIIFNNKSRNVNGTSYSSSEIDYTTNIAEYNMNNVPALKEEPFVNNMNNYRSSVNYELQYVQFPQQTMETYATTWESVVKKIYESDNFGGQLKFSNFFNNVVSTQLENISDPKGKLDKIFFHVQEHMNWNKYYGKYADLGVKKAYKEKTGSVADINLMLVAILREAGLDANPILVSTRDNGVPMFPTNEGFNYVIAAAKIGGDVILMDASNKYTKPNLLPTRALNWFGRLVKKDGTSYDVSTFPKKPSREISMMQLNLNENGDLEGKMRKTFTDYRAYNFRNKNGSTSEDDYLENLENENSGMEISNYEVKNKKVVGKAIMEKFDVFIESQADVIGDKIYFSPLFFKTKKENPFKLEERNYPIDFAYPWQEKYTISIVIPEGYKIESIPESIRLGLEDNIGGFVYKIISKDNQLQIMVDLKMNSAVIPAQNYLGIKEFYKKVVEKETEKVVLSKI